MLSWEPSEAGPRLRAPPRSKPLRFGAQVALRGTDSVGTAFCALPRSEYQVFSKRSHCNLSPFLLLLLSFLGVPLVLLVRQMVTVQHPQKA